MPAHATARAKLAETGIDALCDAIVSGDPLKAICKRIGVDLGSLVRWLEDDPHRAARVWDARRMTAWVFDEQAEATLKAARTNEQITRARELASHYRWRAGKISQRYADKVDVNHSGTITLEALITKSLAPLTIEHEPEE